jgi:hypothetical protein
VLKFININIFFEKINKLKMSNNEEEEKKASEQQQIPENQII